MTSIPLETAPQKPNPGMQPASSMLQDGTMETQFKQVQERHNGLLQFYEFRLVGGKTQKVSAYRLFLMKLEYLLHYSHLILKQLLGLKCIPRYMDAVYDQLPDISDGLKGWESTSKKWSRLFQTFKILHGVDDGEATEEDFSNSKTMEEFKNMKEDVEKEVEMILSVTTKPHANSDELKESLTQTIRFMDSTENMVNNFLERFLTYGGLSLELLSNNNDDENNYASLCVDLLSFNTSDALPCPNVDLENSSKQGWFQLCDIRGWMDLESIYGVMKGNDYKIKAFESLRLAYSKINEIKMVKERVIWINTTVVTAKPTPDKIIEGNLTCYFTNIGKMEKKLEITKDPEEKYNLKAMVSDYGLKYHWYDIKQVALEQMILGWRKKKSKDSFIEAKWLRIIKKIGSELSEYIKLMLQLKKDTEKLLLLKKISANMQNSTSLLHTTLNSDVFKMTHFTGLYLWLEYISKVFSRTLMLITLHCQYKSTLEVMDMMIAMQSAETPTEKRKQLSPDTALKMICNLTKGVKPEDKALDMSMFKSYKWSKTIMSPADGLASCDFSTYTGDESIPKHYCDALRKVRYTTTKFDEIGNDDDNNQKILELLSWNVFHHVLKDLVPTSIKHI
jgi:hypothetical protein